MNGPSSYFHTGLDLKRIGQLLRQAREEMHLSARELSKLASMSATQISRMEAGEDFTITKLVLLAVPLGLPPARLLDEALIVPTATEPGKDFSLLGTGAELHPLLTAASGGGQSATAADLKGLLDFAGMCACLLLLSTNPKATLDKLAVPVASLRRNLEHFIGAYGVETESTERAAVLRAIAQRPARKLRALGLLSNEVIAEYFSGPPANDQNISQGLNYDFEPLDSEAVPKTSSEWSRLVARAIKVTNQRGAKAQLARDLNVSPQAVNQWLTGANAPAAETTLRLLQWVAAAEARKK